MAYLSKTPGGKSAEVADRDGRVLVLLRKGASTAADLVTGARLRVAQVRHSLERLRRKGLIRCKRRTRTTDTMWEVVEE